MGHTKILIIDYCDPDTQEAEKDFWIFHLDTLYTEVQIKTTDLNTE